MEIMNSIDESVSCFDGTEFIDTAYSGLIGSIDFLHADKDKEGYISMDVIGGSYKKEQKDLDIFTPLRGIYIPGSKRCYWTGFVDPVDFPLPDSGCVYLKPTYSDVSFSWITIIKKKRLPDTVICSCKDQLFVYKAYYVYIKKDPQIEPFVNINYFVVGKDGSIHTTVCRKKLRDDRYYVHALNSRDSELTNNYASGAISLLADRRYLWNIRTTERIHNNVFAKVDFGVEPDIVKSLVFARDEPLTPTGRKRPILHWVESHKRRIKNKIKIDIKKHLRGIASFDMGGLNFEITKPIKTNYM